MLKYMKLKANLCCSVILALVVSIAGQLPADPIHTAAEKGDLTAVIKIIEGDPEAVNAQTPGGSTPLHIAVGCKNGEMISFLLASGADANLCTTEGYSPLHWAAFFNAGQAAELLIEKGARIEAKSRTGVTPLQLALTENSPDVAEIIIKRTKSVYLEPSLDDRFVQGENAKNAGDLELAYKIFGELLLKDPENVKINFARGMTCMAMKDYPRARLAFERILMKDPGNDRARLEMARAQAASRQYDAARKNLLEVLSHDIKPEVRANVERFLKDLNKYVKKFTVTGRADIGFFDDSNVNVGPDSEIIDISPIIYGTLVVDELALGAESRPIKSKGQYLSIAASSSWDIGNQGSWLAIADGMFYNNILDEAEHLESRYIMVSAGLTKNEADSAMRMPFRYSHIDTGGNPLADMFGLAPVYRMSKMNGRAWFATSAVLEMRNYTKLNDRDSIYGSLGQSVRMLSEDGKSSVSMSLTVSHDATDAGIYEADGLAWQLSGDHVLPLGILVYARVGRSSLDYAERETLSREKRKDSQRQFVVGITKRFGSRFGIDANYQDTRNTSTFALYQYDREVGTVSAFVSF